MLWEDNQKKIIGEMSFKSDVRSVRMREKKFFKNSVNVKHLY